MNHRGESVPALGAQVRTQTDHVEELQVGVDDRSRRLPVENVDDEGRESLQDLRVTVGTEPQQVPLRIVRHLDPEVVLTAPDVVLLGPVVLRNPGELLAPRHQVPVPFDPVVQRRELLDDAFAPLPNRRVLHGGG